MELQHFNLFVLKYNQILFNFKHVISNNSEKLTTLLARSGLPNKIGSMKVNLSSNFCLGLVVEFP